MADQIYGSQFPPAQENETKQINPNYFYNCCAVFERIKIIHLNIQCISNKIDNLTIFVNYEKHSKCAKTLVRCRQSEYEFQDIQYHHLSAVRRVNTMSPRFMSKIPWKFKISILRDCRRNWNVNRAQLE